jgi:chemosensory pili system protein ChpA (sensor histidine kinase/response regulator)
MNAVTQFDVGPLSWVKNEIDLALGRADQALQHYTASVAGGSGELTQLKFCRTHLHQVQGALTIVGLDGVSQFAEAVEAMLEAIEQQLRPADEASIALAQRALATIGQYLDDLIGGQSNQPLRLLPIYREVQAARGIERVAASDLFFPDLSVRPPVRETPEKAITQAELKGVLRQERSRFQRGFLSWLRSPQDRSGIGEMQGAIKRIEETQDAASARAFWWVAGGFLGALAEGALPPEANAKQLCVRIDLQIRRLLEGSRNVAERLLRDALYLVASADSSSVAVQGVKDAYQLQVLIPSSAAPAPAPQESVRRRLRELITATEESWSKYCVGSVQALPVFRDNASALSAIIEQLGHTDFRRLAQAIAAVANWLSDDSSRHSEALAMEIATAILLAQNAQENFRRLGGDFAHQVDVTVARIHGCLAGNPPQPGSEIPLLDEMSRQAQEKLLVGQVAREIQSNLGQIEQVLDAFFRDGQKRADLASLESPFRQVAGALSMMRHDGAVVAVRECAAEIRRFADPDYDPQDDDFERVANQLSLIGFFIDTLPHGDRDFESFVRQMQPAPASADEALAAAGEAASLSVEQEVARQKLQTHALLGALKEQPGHQGLRDEIKLNLSALKNDADLVADRALGEQTKAMLSMLASGEDASPQIDQVMATLKPPVSGLLKPTAETMQLAQASSEELDAELLGIFLEEAHEVLAAIDENLRILQQQPHKLELLTSIRRSFHTLKGSGRMVGLKDLGEAAWAVEQTLNLWLRQELEVGAQLLDLLAQAHAVFAEWVEHLASRCGKAPDPGPLVALAASLRHGREEGADAQPAAPLAPRAGERRAELAGQRLEAPPSARIITFPPPTVDSGERAADLEEIEIGDVGLGADLDFTPAAAQSPAGEAEGQLRISISPILYEIFSEEARAHLATLQAQLAVLENYPSTPTPHEMYRAAHTLAGISATVGITPLNQLGLELERALLRRDSSACPASLEALATVRQAVDAVDLTLAALAEKRDPDVRPELIEALEAVFPAGVVEAQDGLADHPAAPVPVPAPEAAKAPVLPPALGQIRQLSDEIDEQLLPIFLEEALDLSQGISSQLRAWRSAPVNGECVRTLERLLHTLKGSARMAGAMNLGEIAHAIETRVEQAHCAGEVAPEVLDEIDSAFDAVLHIIERLRAGESLNQLPLPPAGNVLAGAAVCAPAPAERAAPTVSVERRSGRERISEKTDDAAAQRATLRVRADLIDRLANEAGELSIARARIEGEMRSLKGSLLDLTENVIRLRRQLREIEIQAESQMQSRSVQADEQHAGFDPLEFDRFTRFQELTRMMAESVNDVFTVQQSLLKNLDDANAAILAQARLNRDLQQQLMAVRMLPFGNLADRLYRTVRQTSKELGKRANLEISGGQVELDRNVLDKISAPLEHMLRNAIAHGLEERDVRIALGKPAIGELSLALKQEGNEIILTFSDDGAGLNFERIRARAIAAGLLAADEPADTARLAELIFTPGFSTASEVSQVAGRGIGMDVVKTEITRLGGRIEVLSTAGQGTEFHLYIPLTLALTKALLVRAGNRHYAIPSVMIEQVLDLKEAALTRIRVAGSAQWMGHHYPFNYLPHLLGETQALPEPRRQYWVLLLSSATRRISVQVDELMGNEEIVVKNVGPQLARVIGVDGATVLANGQVVLILNPVALSTRAPLAEFAVPVPTAPSVPGRFDGEAASARLPTVMVVDDSLTVRKIAGRLLSREGYQVMTAKDGVDALEQLLDVVPEVMLVDIEMPRMDGFDLTRNIRADARLKDVPIIMITSRIAEKHRAYAFEVGVNDYLGKPYQEDELLRLVAAYVAQRRLTTA